jgi:hypothetical protein
MLVAIAVLLRAPSATGSATSASIWQLRRAQPPAPIVLAVGGGGLRGLRLPVAARLPAAGDRSRQKASAPMIELVRRAHTSVRRRRDRGGVLLGFGAVLAARMIRGDEGPPDARRPRLPLRCPAPCWRSR